MKIVHKEFKIEDHVYLRMKPNKRSLKLVICSKLAPRYCGPFEVIDRIGPVAYRIAFPANMRAHNVFHVSLLKKYVHDLNCSRDFALATGRNGSLLSIGQKGRIPVRMEEQKETNKK